MRVQTTPTILVVFGATGDLTERKIVPALYDLYSRELLPERFEVVGTARRDIGEAAFRACVRDAVRKNRREPCSEEQLEEFASCFRYTPGQFDDPASYRALAEVLGDIDEEWRTCANKLFYLAVPPRFYETILKNLSTSGLTATCTAGEGWTRVLVEKPFGKDIATSRQLDELLATLFDESQIYRIDHYLAKEMLQGIICFRFSNNLLEPSWDARAIEKIEIDLLETVGVEGRGEFYDGVGALRDVGQNHLLQMLALITMDQPASESAEDVRGERRTALRSLVRMTREQVARQTFRAQYDGFRDTPGVAPDSSTETFFKVATMLDSPRWAGVPVLLQGGKRLGEVRKQMVVTFRHPAPCICTSDKHTSNKVVFTLEPDESISIKFWTKKPGFTDELEESDFRAFVHQKDGQPEYADEHSKLLADAIAGDQTLFVSTGEIRAMWEFIDPIVSAWAEDVLPLNRYQPGGDEVLEAAARVSPTEAEAPELVREIGIVGLGKMGKGLARSLLEHGWQVVGYNRTPGVAQSLEPEGVVPATSLAGLVSALSRPRTVWLMVSPGAPVDAVLFGEGGLAGLLEPGDTVIDGGNSHYSSDPPRRKRLSERGIRFVDVGTSGGPEGARHGACLMIGGDREDFGRLHPLWRDLSVPDGFAFFPGDGAGHFVKMVHNGIEYGMMQAIAEGFTVLRASRYSLDLTAAAEVYDHGSVIESRLIEWLGSSLRLHGPDLDGVSGTVGHTGEGEWTVEAAHKLGVRARVIESALQFRLESESNPDWTGQVLSAMREQFGGHNVRPIQPARR